MSDFAIQKSKMDNTFVSGANSSEKFNFSAHLTRKNNVNETNVTNNQTNSDVLKTRMSEILKILSKYNLSQKYVQNLLTERGNVSEQDLLSMNDINFQKLKLCLEAAIKDSLVNGEVDTDKLSRRFIGYKINLLHKGVKTVDEARKNIDAFEKMDLIDFIRLKNSSLQRKDINQITASDIKDAIKNFIIKSLKSEKQKDPKAFMDCFMAMLGKCDDKEKAKIFHAFALLLKDEEMQKEVIPEAYQKFLTTFNDAKELANIINKVGPEILRTLGFDDKTIQIINFQGLEKLDTKQIDTILKDIIEVINKIDEADLLILGEALKAADNNALDQLTDNHKEVLEKYLPYIQNAVSSIALTANRPDLEQQLGEKFQNLLELINSEKFDKIGFSDYIFNQVHQLYEQNPNLFNNMSEDDFARAINKTTQNQYSPAIGDTNTEHLYNEEAENSNVSNGFGFSQLPSNQFISVLTNKQELEQQYGINPNNKKYETALASKQTDMVTSPKEKYSSIKNLTAQDIYDGLANNYIKIYDVLDNYKDLTKSAKDFVNCLIEKMPPAVQSYILDGIGGHEVLDIIKHTNIKPDELKGIVLDYNSRKELEGMEDEKITM